MPKENPINLQNEAFKEGRRRMSRGHIFSDGKELSPDEERILSKEELEKKWAEEAQAYKERNKNK